MAVFNDERYLALALDALAAQTFRDFHLTVHDDGSTDGSAALAEAYAARLALRVIRTEHRGRQLAKEASRAEAADAPYLLVLDSDIALPPDALARMVALLDADPRSAAVSARARAFPGRPLGPAQAFIDDAFYASNDSPGGEARWIVGGCALLRRAALEGLAVRSDVGEDNDLSEQLRGQWRLLSPPDLVADHHGVPVTAGGVLRRFFREGVRVSALLRAHPGSWQIGSLSRLVPLPLFVAAIGGALLGSPMVALVTALLLVAYAGAFLVAMRRVPARLAARLAGATLFTVGNVAFGVGYLIHRLRGSAPVLREPSRPS